VRHRQARLDKHHQFAPRSAAANASVTSGRTGVCGEAQLPVEELIIGFLQPARTQHLVRQIVHVLQGEQPLHQAGRQARLAPTGRADAGKAPIEKPSIIRECIVRS
jgi:hypothetical protein